MGILEDLARDGHTVVVATHDLAGVLAHFPRVVSLNGRVIADGSVDMLRDEQILRATYGGHRATEPHLIADEHHA
jgi:manganese/zinc/iron transport system ATP- binding protein